MRLARGGDGVLAHLHGEGVGRDDECLDGVVRKVAREPGNAAETAAAPGDFWQTRREGAACERQSGIEARILRQQRGKRGGFAGAAQDEDF